MSEDRITAERAARIEAAMRAAFEEAELDAAQIERLELTMTNDDNIDTSSPPSPPTPS